MSDFLYWAVVAWGVSGTVLMAVLPWACSITGDEQPTRLELMLCAALWPLALLSIGVRKIWRL
jgi:hypothetical protein